MSSAETNPFVYQDALRAAAPELLACLLHAVRWHDQLKPADISRYKRVIAVALGKDAGHAVRQKADMNSDDHFTEPDCGSLKSGTFDPADECQEFPPDNIEAMRADDFDQRRRRRAA